MPDNLKDFLDARVIYYNQPKFITDDPISIPRRFTKKQDIEIAGFFAALLAWGNRKSIINSCDKLMRLMNNAPYDCIMQTDWNTDENHFNRFEKFVHRTFNEMDLWHLFNFLQHHYLVAGEQSLETAFTKWMLPGDNNVERALTGFHNYVFNFNEAASREIHCRKHIASPAKKSACKRLNMFLRWMVRKDNAGVDFGIWQSIRPAQLVCPMDVHVSRVAAALQLVASSGKLIAPADWQQAIHLTAFLSKLDPEDPVKYDFALFGLGVEKHYR